MRMLKRRERRAPVRLLPASVCKTAKLLAIAFACLGGSNSTLFATDVTTIGNHPAIYDANGMLRPWTTWRDALDREMKWYARCPIEKGYPRFVVLTFMNGDYTPNAKRPDMIPAMQQATGIFSYLKYFAWTGRQNTQLLAFARSMGDYVIKEASTPDTGKYPRFPRSTGKAFALPQAPDSGCQADRPNEIEPDKGGLAAYALVLLGEETKDDTYLNYALQVAKTLAANMVEGNESRSPWPFRADYRSGEGRGDVSANMSYILRLFDKLIARGHGEFRAPRDKLWHWMKHLQIPNAAKDGMLWVQFHEDYEMLTNRNSWSPMNTARYLVEQKEKLDPDWQQDAKTLIEFTVAHFTTIRSGVPVCGEQDDDTEPWGGALSNYGGVLAMYSAATGNRQYKALARQALDYCLYQIDDDGCPGQTALYRKRGGWQEDAHTDVVHNYMDAIAAFPEWADAK